MPDPTKQKKKVDTGFFDLQSLNVNGNGKSNGYTIEDKNQLPQNNVFDLQSLKKKDTTGNSTNGLPQPTSQLPLQNDKNGISGTSNITPTSNIFDITQEKSDAVNTPDGISISFKNKPDQFQEAQLQGVQDRVFKKIATPLDIQNISSLSGKSEDATKAYLTEGQRKGAAIEHTETVQNTRNKLAGYIDGFNKVYGTSYDAPDVLSSPDKIANFLQVAKNRTLQSSKEIPFSNDVEANAKKLGLQFGMKEITDEMTNQLVQKTVQEDKTAGIPKDKTIAKIAQRLNPKDFANIQKVIDKQNDLTYNQIAIFGKMFDDNKSEDELLNYQKGIAELNYNEALKQNAVNDISKGILINDQNLINSGQQDLDKVDNEIIYKYPALIKQQIAQQVNDQIAKESGVVEGYDTESGHRIERAIGASTQDRLDAMQKLGILDNPKTKDIALSMANNSTYFANNSILGNAIPSFLQPFAELGMSIGDITGFRNDKNILADKIKDQIFPKDFSGNNPNDPNALHLKSDVRISRNIINTTANLAGMLAIATATEGIGTELGLSAKVAQRIGAYTSFGLPSFDASLKDSKNFIDSEPAQYLYATINSIANAEGGRLLDLGKITRIPGVSDKFAKLANELSDKTITEDATKELLDGAKNNYIDFAVKYGTNVTKGAATMAYFNISNNITKLAFGDPSITERDILPQAGHAFLDGVLGMSIMGGFGAAADMRNEKNTTYKGTIYSMALNYDAAKDVFDIGLKNGNYTKPEYEQKIQILNTARVAKNSVDAAEQETGINLTQDQKAVYVANKTAQAVLKNKAEQEGLPEQTKNKYLAQADKLGEQSTQVLDGLKFTPTLEPLYDLYDAEKNYNQAKENLNPNDPKTETELLKAKENYENLYSDYLKNNSSPSIKTETNGKNVKAQKTDAQTSTKENGQAVINNQGVENKAAPLIESAVIEINGKQYEGKNHAEAILKAQEDGQDISKVDRKTQGKFKLSDGSIISRDEAKTRFGSDRSEQLIPQDEAAKQADIQYQKSIEPNKEVSNFPKPDIPIHEMNSEQLGEYANKVKEYNKKLEVDFFGEEGAKKYREAQSISNNSLIHSSDPRYKEANALIDKMEAGLTEQQKNEFYAMSAPEGLIYDPSEIRDIANKVRIVEEAENIDELSSSVKAAVSRMNERKPSNESLAILNAAKKKAVELGINPKDLITEVLKKVGKQYKDIEDMAFMMKTAFEKLSKPTENIELPSSKDQNIKTNTPEEKPSSVNPEDKNIGKYESKAKEIADKIRNAELPQWLVNTDPTIKKSGVSGESLKNVFADAIEHVGRLLDKGVEIKEAIKEGANKIIDHLLTDYPKGAKLKSDYEEKIRNGFENYYKENGANEPPINNIEDVKGNEGNGIGITHAQTNEIANALGFNEYEPKPETVKEWDAEAEKRIKSDPQTIPKLLDKMNKGGQPDKIEQRVIAKYVATLRAEIEKNPSNEKIAEMRRVIDLSNVAGGREVGKSLVARKGIHDINDSLAGYFMTEMDANLDAPLTDKQKETVTNEYNDITDKDKIYKDAIAKLEAENAKLKAEQVLNKGNKKTSSTVKKSTTKTHEDYVSERDKLKEKLKAQKEKQENYLKEQGIQKAGFGFTLTTEMAKTIGEIVRSHVEEIGNKLAEVTKRTFEDVKDLFEGITEKDIHDVIAGEYNEKQKTKSELAKNLFDLKTQAALINKLERLENGTEPKNEKLKIKRNQEIEALRKQITDFKKENPDKEAQLKTLKTKNENELKKVQEELKTGNFAKPEKKIPFIYDTELKKQFPELYKAAVKSQNDLIKAKQEREVRLAIQEYNNRSKYQKLKDKAIRLLNVPRTLMASMDYSAPLRQAVIVTVAHPVMAARAASEMFKASFSQQRFDRWSNDLKDSERYPIMVDSGLSLTDPHSLHLQVQEEAFMGNIAEKIPIVGALIKGSERAYVSYLNKMRADLFNRYADTFEENGRTFGNSPELYKGLASYVNNATGRGNLGFAETAAPVLNTLLFSPRLIASRINMLGLGDIATLGNGFYGKLPKEVRIEAMKDMAKFIAAGIGVLALAKYGFGAQTEDDPRSADFGKIKSGDTRWDIWGGFQPFVRVLAQVIAAQRKSTNTGKIIPLEGKGSKFGTSRVDPLVSFGRGKLAPIPSMVWDALSKRTIQGNKILFQWGGKHKDNEITLKDEAIQHFLPLIYSDVSQAMQDKGISSLFTVGIPSIFGVGVQTYQTKK